MTRHLAKRLRPANGGRTNRVVPPDSASVRGFADDSSPVIAMEWSFADTPAGERHHANPAGGITQLARVRAKTDETGTSSGSDGWMLSQSSIHGVGAHATRAVEAGEELGVSHVARARKATGITKLGESYNHSESPSFEEKRVGTTRRLVARRKVAPAEEVTTDYRRTHDVDNLESPGPSWRS